MSGNLVSMLRRRAPPSLLTWANGITSFVPPPPSPEGPKERIIVLQVHPYGKEPSFTLALGDAVSDSLKTAGAQMSTPRACWLPPSAVGLLVDSSTAAGSLFGVAIYCSSEQPERRGGKNATAGLQSLPSPRRVRVWLRSLMFRHPWPEERFSSIRCHCCVSGVS